LKEIIKKYIKNFYLLHPYFYKLYIKLLRKITKMLNKKLLENSLNITKEKWDYIIILDACRYDYFKKVNKIKGKLFKKISKGSSTIEWLNNTFIGHYENIIYISANPYISITEFNGFCGSKHFYKVDCVWNYGWDKNIETVHPKEVIKATLRNYKRYPDKKLIIHFLQPHSPYIGDIKITSKNFQNSLKNNKKEEGIHVIQTLVKEGKISINKIKRAYVCNLRLVLDHIRKLIEVFDGRIIITSDHGECFGEWFVYHHPKKLYLKNLIEVPYFIIDK